jgi:RNA polymerase sigma-70 factor (ECF subfamily)
VIDDGRAADDARLVDRIATGEEAAFVIAYDRHSSFVFGSVVRFLGDRELAAEIVQDTFVALWRRASQFDRDAGSLLSWLLGIARHRAIDRLRAEGRRPARSSVPLEALGRSTVDAEPDARRAEVVSRQAILDTQAEPDVIVDRRWLQSVVRTCVSELPEDERQVLLLAYSGGLSQAEISSHLDWPLGTVKSRTRRAMAHLRARLATVPDLTDDLAAAGAWAAGNAAGWQDR